MGLFSGRAENSVEKGILGIFEMMAGGSWAFLRRQGQLVVGVFFFRKCFEYCKNSPCLLSTSIPISEISRRIFYRTEFQSC